MLPNGFAIEEKRFVRDLTMFAERRPRPEYPSSDNKDDPSLTTSYVTPGKNCCFFVDPIFVIRQMIPFVNDFNFLYALITSQTNNQKG